MTTNPYLDMAIERVREDARAGVSLARQALAERDPLQARRLGIGLSPQQARVFAATADFFAGRTQPDGKRREPRCNQVLVR